MNDKLCDKLFYQRLDELAERCCERYCPEFTHFLHARGVIDASEYILRNHANVLLHVFGGFADAERKVVGVFPKDVYDNDAVSEDDIRGMFDICGIEILGSGFSDFSHRDVMGSVLALGIKREAMGDIYVPSGGKAAYICLTNVAAGYIAENLTFVARDKVKTRIIGVSGLPEIERKFSVINGTVASDRLDGVLSTALRISREKAKQLLSSGFVSLNHNVEMRPDKAVSESDLISVRGYGRYKVVSLSDLTKKGRFKTEIHKYI